MRAKVRKIKTLSHFTFTVNIDNWTMAIISYCCHMAIQWANQIMFYPAMLSLTTKAWEIRIRQVNLENKLNGLFIQVSVLSGICRRKFSLHIHNFQQYPDSYSPGRVWKSEKSLIINKSSNIFSSCCLRLSEKFFINTMEEKSCFFMSRLWCLL